MLSFVTLIRSITLLLVLICFLPEVPEALAQQEKDFFTAWGLKTHYGFIIPHTEELRPVSSTNPWGFQFDWSQLNVTQKAWEQCNCYSKVGLSFTYFNYDRPEVLGSSYNLIAYAEPFLAYNQSLTVSLRGGLGASYLDQVYDEIENPFNKFFSSPISFLLLANLTLSYSLSPEWDLTFSANYNHISNGGIRSPNKGMNFPTISLGVDYKINPMVLPAREKKKIERGQIQAYGRLFATRRGVESDTATSRSNALLIGLSGGIQSRVANLHALSTGLEIFRDNALSVPARRRGGEKEPYLIGWAVGHHFLFGKFDFNQQMVFYLYKPFQFNDRQFYQRYELAYQLKPNWLAGVSLLAHGATAQNIDLRLGFVF